MPAPNPEASRPHENNRMSIALRVQIFAEDADLWWSRLTEGLVSREVTLLRHGVGGEETTAPALVLFDDLSSDVLAMVASLSAGGRERTFALATSGHVFGESGAWDLLRAGASDAFAWDDDDDPCARIGARLTRWSQIDALVQTPALRRELVGTSPRWLGCLRQAAEMALFSDAPVLLLGESGTGKELLARLVHTLDAQRKEGELVILDCTTIVPELSGSEFFGHERGAFTGAVATRDGAFALADGGTLFLDEVGELPLHLQAQLLRVVQERTYKRVGSNTWQRTSFRLICATHRDLRQDVIAGRFRADFYHRIASRICHLPPLRDRRQDILTLAKHFLKCTRSDAPNVRFDPAVARFLIERDYPGNVRELRQLVGRIGDRHADGGPITVGDIPEDERPEGGSTVPRPSSFDGVVAVALESGIGLREIGRAATESAIRLAVANEDGNLQRAAKRLGVTDRALQLRRAQREN
jgi:transcriptional regulator with GAF, ATPase, and Fis domain